VSDKGFTRKNTLTAKLAEKTKQNLKDSYQIFSYICFLIKKNKKLALKNVFVIIFFIDYVIFYKSYPKDDYFRMSRIFRSFLFPIYSSSIERTVKAVFTSLFRVADVGIFFCLIIFVWAGVGLRIFPDETDIGYTSSQYYDRRINNFTDFSTSSNS
jgi:hypothetical protein